MGRLYLHGDANGVDIKHILHPSFLPNQLATECKKIQEHYAGTLALAAQTAAPHAAGATIQPIPDGAQHPQGPVPPAQAPRTAALREQETPGARQQRIQLLKQKAVEKRAAHAQQQTAEAANMVTPEERAAMVAQSQSLTEQQLDEFQQVEDSMAQDSLTKSVDLVMTVIDSSTIIAATDRVQAETAVRRILHAALQEVASAAGAGGVQTVDQMEVAREMRDLRENTEAMAARCSTLEREKTMLQGQVVQLEKDLEEALESFVSAPILPPLPAPAPAADPDAAAELVSQTEEGAPPSVPPQLGCPGDELDHRDLDEFEADTPEKAAAK